MYHSAAPRSLSSITANISSSTLEFASPKLTDLVYSGENVLESADHSMISIQYYQPLEDVNARLPHASQLGRRRQRYCRDPQGPNNAPHGNGKSPKRIRRDPASRAERQFVCPLFRINPQNYGGLGGCAAWATPEIHRLYSVSPYLFSPAPYLF